MPQHRNAGGPFLIFEPGLGVTGSLQCAGKIAITSESSTPSQPADGFGWLYTKSDGKLYWRSYDVSETDLTSGGGGGGDEIVDADNNTKIQVEESADENKIRFDTAGSERMIIDATGKVGIGMSDPDQKLEVGGAIHISGELGSQSAPSNGDGGILYVKSDGKVYWVSNEVSETDLTAGLPSGAAEGQVLTQGPSGAVWKYLAIGMTVMGVGSIAESDGIKSSLIVADVPAPFVVTAGPTNS